MKHTFQTTIIINIYTLDSIDPEG